MDLNVYVTSMCSKYVNITWSFFYQLCYCYSLIICKNGTFFCKKIGIENCNICEEIKSVLCEQDTEIKLCNEEEIKTYQSLITKWSYFLEDSTVSHVNESTTIGELNVTNIEDKLESYISGIMTLSFFAFLTVLPCIFCIKYMITGNCRINCCPVICCWICSRRRCKTSFLARFISRIRPTSLPHHTHTVHETQHTQLGNQCLTSTSNNELPLPDLIEGRVIIELNSHLSLPNNELEFNFETQELPPDYDTIVFDEELPPSYNEAITVAAK